MVAVLTLVLSTILISVVLVLVSTIVVSLLKFAGSSVVVVKKLVEAPPCSDLSTIYGDIKVLVSALTKALISLPSSSLPTKEKNSFISSSLFDTKFDN